MPNPDSDRSGLVGVLLRDQSYLKAEIQKCSTTLRPLYERELVVVEEKLAKLREGKNFKELT